MTEHRRPPACHYDRHLGERVTKDHRDDCPNPSDHQGCAPCTAPHCDVCGREHLTNDTPQTCPACQLRTDQDLVTIGTAYAALATEALDAGRDGRLVAAAPIPGGTAQVLRGPTVSFLDMRTFRGYTLDNHLEDHPVSERTGKPIDPLPPLAVLADWEDRYRTALGHGPAPLATVHRSVDYLRRQLPVIAQRTDGPDFHAFTVQARALRAQLERALHNERDPERGVECFECGDTLERRWRDPAPCTHSTPARRELQRWARLGYPEALSVLDVRAAYLPCGNCSQGGLDDPRAGLSWECPGCRKQYDPGEYANAVRRDLIDQQMDGAGWCLLTVAADAAAEIARRPVTAATIRTWIARGDDIGTACVWREGQRFGMQIVYWPDVLERATETRRAGRRAVSA